MSEAKCCKLKISAWHLPAVALWVLLGTGLVSNSQAAMIGAINHTHWAINRFSVDGRSGIDIIGPYQGGGGGCCYVAPVQWQAGMTVHVEWETGEAYPDGFPGFADSEKYDAWLDNIDAQTRRHSKDVPVSDHNEKKQCGITVHFLPCDEIAVTTSCIPYGKPDYPINIPLHLPEPKSCPK